MKRALLIAVALAARTTFAACPLPSGASTALASRSDDERWQFVSRALARDRHVSELWTGIWGGVFGLGTAAPLALLPTATTDGDRVDLLIGGVSSAIGMALLVVSPLPVLDAPNLPARASGCEELARAEGWLAKSADGEAFGRSWVMHAANVAFGVAVGLVLGLGFGRWVSAAINAAANIALGEAMVLTQPDDAVRALDAYRRGDLPAAPQASISFAW